MKNLNPDNDSTAAQTMSINETRTENQELSTTDEQSEDAPLAMTLRSKKKFSLVLEPFMTSECSVETVASSTKPDDIKMLSH